MPYTISYHPLVELDVLKAYEWYEDRLSGLGERLLVEIENRYQKILLHPENYGSRSNRKYREVMVKDFPYLIVYRIDKKKSEIYIVKVHNVRESLKKKYRK